MSEPSDEDYEARATAARAEWIEDSRGGVTADELIAALDKAEGPEIDAYDWPYIDASIEIIDGGLRPLVNWLLRNYEIRPRP